MDEGFSGQVGQILTFSVHSLDKTVTQSKLTEPLLTSPFQIPPSASVKLASKLHAS